MGIRLTYFLQKHKGKTNSKRALIRYGSPALGMFHYHPSAQQRLKEFRGPSTAQKRRTKNMPNNLVQIQNKNALHLPLITLMEVPL